MPEWAAHPLVLDTHVWLWLMEGRKHEISDSALEAISAAAHGGRVRVGAISFWEISMLAERGRIRLSLPAREWMERSLQAPGVETVPLSPAIAFESTQLPEPAHGDPADRLLMATARVLGGTLATRDRNILSYASLGHLSVLDVTP